MPEDLDHLSFAPEPELLTLPMTEADYRWWVSAPNAAVFKNRPATEETK